MSFRLRTIVLASIAIGVLGLASGATSVQPAETAKGPSGHCVTVLSKSAAPTCYDSFTAAIAAATGGRVTDAPADPRVAMNDQSFLAKLKASGDKDGITTAPQGANVLIATFFADESLAGPTVSWVGPSCTTALDDIDGAVSYVGDDWNFGSFVAFNNCRVRLWQHRDFQGGMLDWARARFDFGKLADDVSSFQFS